MARLIELRNYPVKNVQKFRYLGFYLHTDPRAAKLDEQTSMAWDKCPEIKHIFTDRKIHIPLWIRANMLESTVRARLSYAVQTRLLLQNYRKLFFLRSKSILQFQSENYAE